MVVPGFVGSWFLEPMGVSTGWLRVLTCLRVLRLVRLVSAVKAFSAFRELWLLVKGLTDSARMIFWTCIIIGYCFFISFILKALVFIVFTIPACSTILLVLGAVHFMFGIAFVEVVGKAPENQDDEYIQVVKGRPSCPSPRLPFLSILSGSLRKALYDDAESLPSDDPRWLGWKYRPPSAGVPLSSHSPVYLHGTECDGSVQPRDSSDR